MLAERKGLQQDNQNILPLLSYIELLELELVMLG